MLRQYFRGLSVCVLAFGLMAASAPAFHDGDDDASAMAPVFQSPTVPPATNSDLAFWGDRAYAGNYGGFRIFDISNPAAPAQLVDFKCDGPQNDPVVYENKLLFLAVDRTMTGPECGSARSVEHDDPDGWEGVRIFDVSNPAAPRQIKSVYTDCGAHTITMYPKNPGEIMLYVSSYPLRPGPTCGAVRGPESGNSPLHEKISVIRVPVNNPKAAKVVAEPKISYPGDADNKFDPDEHGLQGFGDLTACHDIGVFVELRLAAGACAEQAQLWRIKPNGVPDTEHPIWVFDDQVDETGTTGDPADTGVVVDFWHSATFSWDGKVVNFIDESFGDGCPPITPAAGSTATMAGDTGRMFFLDTATGSKLSHFMIPRPEPGAYCSAHLGNVVRAADRRLLVNAWYMGGADVIDFTDPANPEEIAFYDAAPAGPTGSDNRSAYWYEGPPLSKDTLTLYGTDGVHNPPTGRGFQVFEAAIDADEQPLAYLNPQTQEKRLGLDARKPKGAGATKGNTTRTARGSRARAPGAGSAGQRAAHLAP